MVAAVVAWVGGMACANTLDMQYAAGLSTARQEYTQVRNQLEGVVYALEQYGLEALKTNTSLSLESTFIIDPASGRILLGENKGYGEYALINGRSIARSAILRWQDQQDNDFFEQIGAGQDVYRLFYSSLAITLDGKLYVVTVGRKSVELERLFIRRLIDKACDAIRKNGLEKAFALFDDSEGEFRTEYTYVFVYDEKDHCLFNPNYQELVGKTPPEMEKTIGRVVQDFLMLAKEKGEGWQKVTVRNPVTKEPEEKELYVKRFFYDGQYYTVGSGIYDKEP